MNARRAFVNTTAVFRYELLGVWGSQLCYQHSQHSPKGLLCAEVLGCYLGPHSYLFVLLSPLASPWSSEYCTPQVYWQLTLSLISRWHLEVLPLFLPAGTPDTHHTYTNPTAVGFICFLCWGFCLGFLIWHLSLLLTLSRGLGYMLVALTPAPALPPNTHTLLWAFLYCLDS